MGAPRLEYSFKNAPLPDPLFTNQAFPKPSIAIPPSPSTPPVLMLSEMVKSLGCAPSADPKGGFAVERPYNAAMFAPGLCAMLIAAVAVSEGIVPLEPADCALLNRSE